MMWMGACDEMTDFFFSKKVICKKCGCQKWEKKNKIKMKFENHIFFGGI